MNAINTPWLILIAYWVITAFGARKNQRAEPIGSRLLTLAGMILALAVLFGSRWWSGALAKRFVPDVPTVRDLGIFLLWAGIGFAIWARYHIGEYWSARVAIKADHKVIDSGPYAYIRHPIYTGILLAMVGTGLAAGKWQSVVAFFLILIVLFMKARAEEKMLTEQLGGSYVEYKKRTGMLIPLWKTASR